MTQLPLSPVTETLEQCPICECTDTRMEDVVATGEWRVRCEKCGCQTCWWHSEQAARRAWNTRAAGHAQTGQQQTGGDFYLVPREIIDQFPEININNYDHDDACAVNAWGCEVVTNANPAFGPSDTSTASTAQTPATSNVEETVSRIMVIRNGMILDGDAEALIRKEIANHTKRPASGVLAEVAAERARQIEVEGYDAAHDDEHTDGSIAAAAAAYALAASYRDTVRALNGTFSQYSNGTYSIFANIWKWDWEWFKPKDRRQDLIRSAALAVAEVERIDRTVSDTSTDCEGK
jgi:hypothetical protein